MLSERNDVPNMTVNTFPMTKKLQNHPLHACTENRSYILLYTFSTVFFPNSGKLYYICESPRNEFEVFHNIFNGFLIASESTIKLFLYIANILSLFQNCLYIKYTLLFVVALKYSYIVSFK